MFHVKHFSCIVPIPENGGAMNSTYNLKNVSRETLSTLERYVALLQKWNKAINLVGKSTEREIWDRHIVDSLQLLPLIPDSVSTLADFGSGAGLPGMVIGIAKPSIAVTLVEQDQRKAAFLQETAAQLGLKNVTVENRDIHSITARFDLITARALAPLDTLCAMAFPRMCTDAICLFPKGKNFANEVADARVNWSFKNQLIHSATNQESSIVSISELSPQARQSIA
jgi:16S rRNA (guanine527-N7)-methyltransferase